MSGSADVGFLLLLVVVLLAAVVFAVVRWRAAVVAARVACADADGWAREAAMRDAELAHLVERRLPAQADEGRAGGRVPGLLHAELSGSELAEWHAAVLEAVAGQQARAEGAARGVLLAVARTLGGLANDVQARISRMQAAHDDPGVLAGLMEIDHGVALVLRRSEAMRVFCRSWPGRQHDATLLVDVLRGAVGRITAYRRVQIVRLDDTRAVVGRLVGPLVMGLAELLENATRFSDPNTPVQVHDQLTTQGVALVIEDAGLGLSPADLEKATRLLTEPELSTADLGSPPHFGLATCGALARRYGFGVSVDNGSAFGGVRAVITIPGVLLTEPPQPPGLASRPDQPPVPVASSNGTAAAEDLVAGTTPDGLPKRRRLLAPPAAEPDPLRGATAAPPRRTAWEAGQTLGAFRATSAGQAPRPGRDGAGESGAAGTDWGLSEGGEER